MKISKELWENSVSLYNLREGDISRIDLEKEFNISQSTSQAILNMLQNMDLFDSGVEINPKLKKETSDDEIHLDSLSYNIKTLEDLISFAEIDINEWEVSKVITNTWGNVNNPCYQIKAWFRKKDKTKIDIKELCEIVKKEISIYSKPEFIKREIKQDACMLEVALVDHHFGQMSWGKETGFGNYDIKIARDLYFDAINYIISSVSNFTIDKIMYIMGHDFFNVNNQNNTTAGGTPQDEDCRWQKSFTEGIKIHVDSINKLKQIADVEVIQIAGNHDEERSFYAGTVLEAWFKEDKNVIVDNDPLIRKYKKYGKNLLGFTHAYQIRYDRLFNLMPIEAKKFWSDCEYYEWHVGHVHHENKKILNLDTEENKIKLRTLPSLVAPDAWHIKKGFLSNRETHAFLWHPEKGNILQFNYKP